jgi:hypothetical protein
LAGVDLTSAYSKKTEESDAPRLSIHDSVPAHQLLTVSEQASLPLLILLLLLLSMKEEKMEIAIPEMIND